MANGNSQSIQLTVTLPEVNQILEALAQKPYGEVFQLISNIQNQAQSQLKIETEIAPDTASEAVAETPSEQ